MVKGGLESFKSITGGLKQWIRGPKTTYRFSQRSKTYGIAWGAGKRHVKKIGSKFIRDLNTKLRKLKIPIDNWRFKDSGHMHFWKK